MELQLKKVEFSERMSEETNCFCADLWVDGNKCATVQNKGHGGETHYEAYPDMMPLLKQAEQYAEGLPDIKSESLHFSYPSNLEHAIDGLFDLWLVIKLKKKMQRLSKKALLFGTENDYTSISWTGVKDLKEVSLKELQRLYDERKEKGCLNPKDQLTQLGIVI